MQQYIVFLLLINITFFNNNYTCKHQHIIFNITKDFYQQYQPITTIYFQCFFNITNQEHKTIIATTLTNSVNNTTNQQSQQHHQEPLPFSTTQINKNNYCIFSATSNSNKTTTRLTKSINFYFQQWTNYFLQHQLHVANTNTIFQNTNWKQTNNYYCNNNNNYLSTTKNM